MNKYYDFVEGGWYILPFKKGMYKYTLWICFRSIKILWNMGIIIGTFFITLWIFRGCIKDNTLNEMISLGAVFATFGSAAISIFSLNCNEQIIHFQNNISILQNNLIKTEKWSRWRFLKKIEKRELGFCEVKTPKIHFYKQSKKLSIPIPTDISDFKDISVGWYYFRFLLFSPSYLTHLSIEMSSLKETDAFLIFRCLKDIYQSILCFKVSNFFIWVGSGFILSSVAFSFFYPQINFFVVTLGK
ncbi:MAG: hypothetical protein K2H41_04910 [Acetatifactor sp.]|nr:hypothetical protein [Acetatifactor sp.]